MAGYDQGANETGTPGTRAGDDGKGEDPGFADYGALEQTPLSLIRFRGFPFAV